VWRHRNARAVAMLRHSAGLSGSQRPVVSRGGCWEVIQISTAARIATRMPTTTHTVMAAVVAWKPRTHGEIRVHNPTIRFSHSSQTANAASAAIASTAMITPTILAFTAAVLPANPKIQGDTNRNAPRIRFATSQYLALVQSLIFPSIEVDSPAWNK